ncbi:hypothetical protein PIB30_047870 [Stylosanthes scabra]|uniref:Uncharacterized protein n=1 Tax=Stylosanthes scabra TaxID=79078 RepID=A0ABU6WIJ8_9FABA|nr:hypothetical protein [Stylosanthes scabra]
MVHLLSLQMDGNPTFMNGQGLDPSQIGYHFDNSSDGYFSYEDSLLACQIDNDEFQHRASLKQYSKLWYKKGLKFWKIKRN